MANLYDLVSISLQVAASTECKCDTDQKICTPPDGDIDCRNCGVYYKLGQGDSFPCVKRCPDGYYGSQSLSLCVPCLTITEQCSGCSNYNGTPRCDDCDYPYTIDDRNNVCIGQTITKASGTSYFVYVWVIAIVVALIITTLGYVIWHRTHKHMTRITPKATPHRRLREDDSESLDGGDVATVREARIQPLRADMEVRQPQSTLSDTDFSEFNERFYWTFKVGPAGGIFQVMNIMLSIAKDAVDEAVTFKIGVSHNDQDRPPLKQDYSVVGPIIHCLPHELQFRKPVALSFGCNLHLAEPDASPNLQMLYSESDVDDIPSWKIHDSASCHFVVDGSRRCLVFLDHFCVFSNTDVLVIAFLKVWHNMHPSCSFILHLTTLDVATDISCTVMAEQKNGDEGNAFQESSRHLRQITTTSTLSTIPHQLKMQLASLLDPRDHIQGHDWRSLAGVLGKNLFRLMK
ncbi:hypothetical protein LSAT2_024199 [Lamellibrachia satsuma]|nr:hypothetical protein LSAT2_024199 [Lamellibrachia satsuma]